MILFTPSISLVSARRLLVLYDSLGHSLSHFFKEDISAFDPTRSEAYSA